MTDITMTDLTKLLQQNDHEFILPLKKGLAFKLMRRNGNGASSLLYTNGHIVNIPFLTGKYDAKSVNTDQDLREKVEGFLEYIASKVTPDTIKGCISSLGIGSGIDTALAEEYIRNVDGIDKDVLRERHHSMSIKYLAWSLVNSTFEISAKNIGLFGYFLSDRQARLCDSLQPFYGYAYQASTDVARETGRAMAVLAEHYAHRNKD